MLSGPDDFMSLYKHFYKEATEGKYVSNHNTEIEKNVGGGKKFRGIWPSVSFLLVSDILHMAFHSFHTIFTSM